MEKPLPSIPVKRYFTIGEVGELCGVKPHVLRYWEQEFTQLRPMKRRGNRRYYQHHEVLMIRRIRDLLYDQGFTISGARNKLQELAQIDRERRRVTQVPGASANAEAAHRNDPLASELQEAIIADTAVEEASLVRNVPALETAHLLRELVEIRELLTLGR